MIPRPLIDPVPEADWRSPQVQLNCMGWLTRADWPAMGGPYSDAQFCRACVDEFEQDVEKYGSQSFLLEYLIQRKARAVAWLLSH